MSPVIDAEAAPRPAAAPKPARRVSLIWRTRWFGVGFIVLLLALWEVAAASGAVPSMSFPPFLLDSSHREAGGPKRGVLA